jgi:hypothetical protein
LFVLTSGVYRGIESKGLSVRNKQPLTPFLSSADGNSTPGPIDINTPPEAFKFLTTEQSLADIDRFARTFARPNIKHDLRPSKTPWIFIGGSYPGMRAAFMRTKYPDTIFAGFASSAPVQAKIDMTSYFDPIYRGMQAYGFGNCSRDIQASVRWVDDMLERKGSAKTVKEMFLGLGGAENSHATFADALTVIFYLWQGYGMDGSGWGLRYLCDHMATDPRTNKTSPAKGWAASKGGEWSARRWATWPHWNDMVNSYMGTDCSGSLTKRGNCNLDQRWADKSTIAWTWQYCTQWGYFQAANVGPMQLVSKHNSLRHQRDLCHRQFPTANLREHGFPEWPDVERTNRVFGGWDLRPSHVYWSAGEFDPWRTLGPLSAEAWAPKVRPFREAPKCWEGQRRGEVFGYTLPGAQHCYDFRASYLFPGGEVSRKYFTDALDRWLPCFRPKKG